VKAILPTNSAAPESVSISSRPNKTALSEIWDQLEEEGRGKSRLEDEALD